MEKRSIKTKIESKKKSTHEIKAEKKNKDDNRTQTEELRQ